MNHAYACFVMWTWESIMPIYYSSDHQAVFFSNDWVYRGEGFNTINIKVIYF